MFPNSKTPAQTTTLRSANNKSSTNTTAPDPIKDAYKLKSQIDAVQKSQQSFKTSEIIQIQTKLLTKAWKWINKYGIGSLNQYTKMKKQIQNYDILITTIAAMQKDIHQNFKSLHRINQQHSISLNNIQSNICINNNHLRQFKSNINKQFIKTHNDKQQIVSLLTNSNQSLHSLNANENINENDTQIDEQMDEIELPLNIKQINNIANSNNNSSNEEELMPLSEQISPNINLNFENKQFEEEDSDVMNDKISVSNTENIKSKWSHSLDHVDTMSVTTIDVSAYKSQELLVENNNKFSQSLLLSERDRSESVIKLNDNSMMKESVNKLEKSVSDGNYNIYTKEKQQRENERVFNDFNVTNKENKVMDSIMNNLTKLDELSNYLNNFIVNDSEKYKIETQQIIKTKIKPLHEILEQRELGLLSELRYLHKEKLVKMKQKQNKMKQNQNYLKIKLSECQNILQKYQIKWEQQCKLLKNNLNNNENNNNNFDKKLRNLRITLIKQRTNQLNTIKNEVNQCIEIKMLQREIDNIKQMYMFTVNSAQLHSIKQKLQNLGEFVDFAVGNIKNGSNKKLFNKKRAVTMSVSQASTPKINAFVNEMEGKIDSKGKFSNMLNKKFNEFIRRKQNQNNSQNNNQNDGVSIYNDSGMNLDHVNAVDAQSVSSGGNQSDNDTDTNINKSNSNLNNNQGNRASVSISSSAPPSEVMTDLP